MLMTTMIQRKKEYKKWRSHRTKQQSQEKKATHMQSPFLLLKST